MATTTTLEEAMTCDYGGGWVWGHGWQDKRKFKGHVLSKRHLYEVLDDLDALAIVRAPVRHGWVFTVAGGDMSGCGWDATMYFRTEEPEVVDGYWWGVTRYDEDGDDAGPAEVLDGPHKATWLEVEQ